MLNDAINQIREDVLKGKELQAAVKTAAEDFELNPVLVARKFQEKFGSAEQVLACAAHCANQMEFVLARMSNGRLTVVDARMP